METTFVAAESKLSNESRLSDDLESLAASALNKAGLKASSRVRNPKGDVAVTHTATPIGAGGTVLISVLATFTVR